MAQFSVRIECEAPEKAAKALDRAGIPRFGPASTKFTETPDPPLVSPSMFTRVNADSAAAAEAHLREIVGDDCQVGPTELVGD